ncbi:DEAD/DEAH box helicase [Reichenbachiella versicolor]|uniref:DEAD/DEAH box helicase n=1 Tax=Reichenbachiella versicolor TaxID=1821036 RepID=UPI000D6E4A0B|nr:DEAD/DEAH box helicase [Reichenbachiella versicolor]
MNKQEITFEDFGLNKQLKNSITELGYQTPTPIQIEAFPVIKSGKDVIGISQTGTGKTFAYMLPILHQLKFSNQTSPRVLILVPTRELVVQVVENIESYSKYQSIRVLGVYGEANINVQAESIIEGLDIIVGTPGRLYDLCVNRILKLNDIKKLVIDEVDVMLDLGFRTQLAHLFELLPERRQNIMFSATMTEEVDELIQTNFISPKKITIAVSGTPLENIEQTSYYAQNFHTKANLLIHFIQSNPSFEKVLVFVSSKKIADRLDLRLTDELGSKSCVIHSNKSQNYRLRSLEEFDSGQKKVLIATDVISRGLDLNQISHVINFDTPNYPENYMHRIGRTGRAEAKGQSILLFNEEEESQKLEIEMLMDQEILELPWPEEVKITDQKIPEEKKRVAYSNFNRKTKIHEAGPSTHEKKDKNKKVNLGGSYKRKIEAKYKKPKKRGQKRKK